MAEGSSGLINTMGKGANTNGETHRNAMAMHLEVAPSPTIIAGAANFEMKNKAHTSELKEIPIVVATSATESDLASLLNMRLIPRRTSGSVKLVVFDLEARSSRRSASCA